MPPPDLSKIAADLEASARRLKAKGDHEGAAAAFEAAADLREALRGLQGVPKARTLIDEMAHPATAVEPRRRGRPTKSKHPFPRALEAKGLTVAEWAVANKLDRSLVKSWFAPGAAGRRIPAFWATRIAKEFRDPKTGESVVPATEDVWRNGIR